MGVGRDFLRDKIWGEVLNHWSSTNEGTNTRNKTAKLFNVLIYFDDSIKVLFRASIHLNE